MKLNYLPKNHNVVHATFIQMVVLIVLTAVSGAYSGLVSCLGSDKADCTTNSVLAVVLVVLAVIWLGFLSALSYAAWVRRTITLIVLFIILEIITTGISAFDLKHFDNVVGLIVSLLDLLAGLWVLFMSYRLFRLCGTSSAPTTGRKRSQLNHK